MLCTTQVNESVIFLSYAPMFTTKFSVYTLLIGSARMMVGPAMTETCAGTVDSSSATLKLLAAPFVLVKVST